MFAQVDVLTQRYDNQRTGFSTRENILTPDSVRTRFGKQWTLYSDAKIMAQPLYVSNLKSAKCPAGCNTVIFASMKGTIYAYMADQKPQTVNDTLVWARYLSDGRACNCPATGPQNGSGDFDMWATDDPWWGILGTPVIDRASNLIYAVTWTNDGQYRLYGLSIIDGSIRKGPVVVQGSVGGVSFVENGPGWKQLRKQRPALLLDGGLLYVSFGGDNQQALAGWLFVFDANTLALKTVWSPTPGGRNGGLWQSGQGPSSDGAGNIYMHTGDGDFDPKRQWYGNSLVKLRLETGGMAVTDFFTPCNQLFLSKCDLDHGSAGPVLFNDLVVGGGKYGELYLMRTNQLAKYQPGPFAPPANVCNSIVDCQNRPELLQKFRGAVGHMHGSPVFWKGSGGKSWLYVMGEGDRLKAFPFTNGKFDTNAVRQSKYMPPHPGFQFCGGPLEHSMPGGIMGVSSNGSAPKTGIVWVLVPVNGDANTHRGVKGMLMAFDAEDVSKEIWRSQGPDPGAADTANSFGLLARFNAPTVANGKVFVPNAGDKEPLFRYCNGNRPQKFPQNYGLVVYGLK